MGNVHESLDEPVSLDFERLIQPPEGYLRWLAKEAEKHPLRYIRAQAREHVSKGKALETSSHVDVVLEDKDLLTWVEMKFTSDISPQTTFNNYRNQLARTIDSGIFMAEKKGKRLVVLLCSPSGFYRKRSRFYHYKLQEYADFNKIKDDIVWRELAEIQKYLLAVAWVSLEEVIEVIYRDRDLPQLLEAKAFFRERML